MSAHARAITWKSWLQFGTTLGLFVLGWAAAYRAADVSWWLAALIAVPTAGLVLKLFIIQHDCGHGSFFRSTRLNHVVGRVASIVTMIPYDAWRRDHTEHHATSGNLDRRGVGDIDTLTIEEYRKLPRTGRLRYRIYRHPLVLFGLGPIYFFLLKMRVPTRTPPDRKSDFRSVMGTNLIVFACLALTAGLLDWSRVLILQGIVSYIAGCAGIWFFYVQHQFDKTVWEPGSTWSFQEAAIWGSSYYDLPKPLPWFSGNIGMHHVHHLCHRVPNYRLPEILRAMPELRHINRFTLRDSVPMLWLALWDADDRRMITFREFDRRARAA